MNNLCILTHENSKFMINELKDEDLIYAKMEKIMKIAKYSLLVFDLIIFLFSKDKTSDNALGCMLYVGFLNMVILTMFYNFIKGFIPLPNPKEYDSLFVIKNAFLNFLLNFFAVPIYSLYAFLILNNSIVKVLACIGMFLGASSWLIAIGAYLFFFYYLFKEYIIKQEHDRTSILLVIILFVNLLILFFK